MKVREVIQLLRENYKLDQEIAFVYWANEEGTFLSSSEENITDLVWQEAVEEFQETTGLGIDMHNEIQQIIYDLENVGKRFRPLKPLNNVFNPITWDWGNNE